MIQPSHATDWHRRGGLVARGVFIDYKLWADRNGIAYSPFSAHRVTVREIETVAREQGVQFKPGDVFIIRTGFTDALTPMSAAEQADALGTHQTCGVEGNEASARWFWDQHFAAVAGDAIAFETIPPLQEDGQPAGIDGLGEFLVLCVAIYLCPDSKALDLAEVKEKRENSANRGRSSA